MNKVSGRQPQRKNEQTSLPPSVILRRKRNRNAIRSTAVLLVKPAFTSRRSVNNRNRTNKQREAGGRGKSNEAEQNNTHRALSRVLLFADFRHHP